MEMNAEILNLRVPYGHGLLKNSGYDWVTEALSIYLSAKLIEIKCSHVSANRVSK
jgi:hypothetical protein